MEEKKAHAGEKQKQKGFFKLPVIENYQDYKVYVNLLVLAVIFVIGKLFTIYVQSLLIISIFRFTEFFVLLFLYRGVLERDFGVFKNHFFKYLRFFLVVFPVYFFIMLIVNGVTIDGVMLGSSPNQAGFESVQRTSIVFSIIAAAVVAPIMEELLYRRIVRLAVPNVFFYYLISASLFAATHNIFVASITQSLLYSIPYFVAGLAYAIFYKKTNNIWVPIIIHMVSNSLSVLLSQIL